MQDYNDSGVSLALLLFEIPMNIQPGGFMKHVIATIFFTLFVLHGGEAFTFVDLMNGEWVGDGTYTIGDSSFQVRGNLSIYARKDRVEVKYLSGAFIAKELGGVGLKFMRDFYANFTGVNEFEVYVTKDIIIEKIIDGEKKNFAVTEEYNVGEGSCTENNSLGLICDYSYSFEDESLSETIVFGKKGGLVRIGFITIKDKKESWALLLSPRRKIRSTKVNFVQR